MKVELGKLVTAEYRKMQAVTTLCRLQYMAWQRYPSLQQAVVCAKVAGTTSSEGFLVSAIFERGRLQYMEQPIRLFVRRKKIQSVVIKSASNPATDP